MAKKFVLRPEFTMAILPGGKVVRPHDSPLEGVEYEGLTHLLMELPDVPAIVPVSDPVSDPKVEVPEPEKSPVVDALEVTAVTVEPSVPATDSPVDADPEKMKKGRRPKK